MSIVYGIVPHDDNASPLALKIEKAHPDKTGTPELESIYHTVPGFSAITNHPHLGRYFHSYHIAAANDEKPPQLAHLLQKMPEGSKTLTQLIVERKKSNGRMTIRELVQALLHTAKGLAQLHQHNLAHRDVKPGNIMQVSMAEVEEGLFRWLLNDYDTVRKQGEVLEGNLVSGTIKYMSPEQFYNRSVEVQSDVYSLTKILYWCIEEYVAASDRTYEYFAGHILDEKKITTRRELAKIINPMLETDPGERPPIARVIEQFEALLKSDLQELNAPLLGL
ncbi:protein kinase [Candidatus Peregrinibacteria bacterium]|nr:MAG: protein kinase [Candidatus Peregrinibacteria bacterium]